jgi:tetraacyldisaccharide 4'-kinase
VLSSLYDVGLEAYLGLEKAGIRRREKLPVPVLSIGNLTVGGTGKTPMAQSICRSLTSRGYRIALLSRGHGGKKKPYQVVSDGNANVFLGPDEAGDEPVLLAQSLPKVPVIVGKDRRITGREALRRHGLDAIVLDDGLQYWQLDRDLDVVLMDSSRPFDNGRTLPRGLLREPARHLNRASIAVFTRSEALDENDRQRYRAVVRDYSPNAKVFFARHRAASFIRLDTSSGHEEPLELLSGVPVLALSGIAQPQKFRETLAAEAGCSVVQSVDWTDHHKIGTADIRQVHDLAVNSGAKALVMTEKDAVKWTALNPAALSLPVFALRIAMEVDKPDEFVDMIINRLFGKAPY